MAKRHMKRFLTSSIMQIKTTMRYHLTIVRIWPPSKSLETINAGEDVVKGESSYTAGRNVKRYSHYGQQYRGSLKT